MRKKKIIGTLQVIFKVVERCNLNCSYCYYYSEANVKTHSRPSIIAKGDVMAITEFLALACSDFKIKNIQVIFHGGEPTLLKPSMFSWICEQLMETLGKLTNLSFALQTNGVYLSEGHLDVIREHKIAVGVSIDGSKSYNDIFRVDHKGFGSYDRVSKTIARLNAEAKSGEIAPVGVISVLNSKFDYSEFYAHISGALGVRLVNLLLPDANWDQLPPDVEAYGSILCKIFDDWLEMGQENVSVRQFDEILKLFSEGAGTIELSSDYIRNQIIVFHTDGHIAIDDTLMPAASWYKNAETVHASSTSLLKWLNKEIFAELFSIRSAIPSECRDCRWVNLCRGGDVENRFSVETGFSRKSVYCKSLIALYEHVANVLLEGGYPREKLEAVINGPMHGGN